ncbi:MAG: DNA primase [Deltaproteobacteria bacterium]|nr:DNA primase [Deltaproteobacteria bacterium]
MGASGDIIQQVKERADIVRVIGERVHLTAAGRNWKGLCPFHQEKTPSFQVNPERRMFHCFGCGKGGSVIDFVMEVERIPFAEALAKLASGLGLSMDRDKPARGGERDRLGLEQARAFYHGRLLEHPEGETARRYLYQRGFEEPAWKTFQLGFAPEGWQSITDRLLNEGFSPEEALATGLVKRSPTGRLYDLMRNRITFPIQDESGRTLSFGGRLLEGEEGPKYLNTPETRLYHKSKVLYGLAQARDTLRKSGRAILVEGYLDVVRCHLAGFTQAVATCGTALTPQHLDLLERFAQKVVLVFDGDQAGIKASLASAPLFFNRGVEGAVVTLPDGLDPDDFIRQRGPEAFQEQLERATPLLEYLVFQTLERQGRSPQGRERALRELSPLLEGIQRETVRDMTIRHLADLVGVRPEAIRIQSPQAPAVQAGQAPTEVVWPAAQRRQRMFLGLVFKHRTLLARAREILAPDELTDPPLAALYAKLLRLTDQEFASVPPEELAEVFPEVGEPMRSLLLDAPLQTRVGVVKEPLAELDHLAAAMKEGRKTDLLRKVKEAVGEEEKIQWTRELQAVRRELSALKASRKGYG